jgi:hypothetical protein
MRRMLVAVFFGTLVAGACFQSALRNFAPSAFHASQLLPDSLWARPNLRKNQPWMPVQSGRHQKLLTRIPGVYPYSVVPGGVKNADDLRNVASRDYVVRRHFANFDFSRAQLIRSAEAREVYLSYRIRNTVFWTRKRVRLLPGELLLTDGNITARARCGNQISDTAKPEVSEEEPAEDVLDQPVAVAEAPVPPIRPVLPPPDLPTGQPAAPMLFAGGGFIFPYAPLGPPIPNRVCPAGETDMDGHCRHKHKPPVTPEPPTMVLLGFGLVLVWWRYRKTVCPARA